MELLSEWVQILAAIGTVAAAIASWLAASAARDSAVSASKGVLTAEKYGKAQLYTRLWEEYASVNTYNYIRILKAYDPKTVRTEVTIDAARYLLNFYHRVYIMYNQGLIEPDMVVELASASGFHWTKEKALDLMEKEYKEHGLRPLRKRADWFDDFETKLYGLRAPAPAQKAPH
jgi:hypothetical protein